MNAVAPRLKSLRPVAESTPNGPVGDMPEAPDSSPLGLGVWAFTRRDVGASAGSVAVANSTASAVFGNSLIVSQDTGWREGLLREPSTLRRPTICRCTTRCSTAPAWAERSHSRPVVTSLPDNPGIFTCPRHDHSGQSGLNEQFSILVSEETPFDTFLKGLPVVGLLVDPVLKLLHQVPVLNQLLSPLIGDAQTVYFDENAYSLTDQRPVAFTTMMPSFDGTLISVNYFPAVDVATGEVDSAPTVLNGPDLGLPGGTNPYNAWATSLVNIVPGIDPLRNDASPFPDGYSGGGGFNVITWDPRGEYLSGGTMQLDNPFWEGRDVSSIIDWAISSSNVAQTQIKTDLTGDPYIGMIGGSCGGGIQPTVAGTPDKRVDAIVPSIAWNTLNDSPYPNRVFKTVIGAELLLALVATGANFNKAIPRGPHRCSLRVDQRKGAGGADRGGRGHAGEQYRSAHPATTGDRRHPSSNWTRRRPPASRSTRRTRRCQ